MIQTIIDEKNWNTNMIYQFNKATDKNLKT